MARLSNCGKSETGGIYGQPGDQTQQEYWNINYWSNGWQYVFRHPSPSVASLISLYAEHAAANDHIGYSQSGRETLWQQISFLTGSHDPAKITADCNADCSSSTMAIIRAVGLDKGVPALAGADISWTTYQMVPGLASLGFEKLGFTGEGMLKPGDILMTDGHACIVIGAKPEDGLTEDKPADEPADDPAELKEPAIDIKYMPVQLPIIKPNMAKTELQAVAILELICNYHGAHLTVNGLYGISDQTFVYSWQKKHGLLADKEVGAETWRSLFTEE